MNRNFRYILAVILTGFGLLTLFLSTSVLFDLFGIRAKQGSYVPFVVGANFICSILYLLAAYGFIKSKRWTTLFLGGSLLLLIATFIGLNMHISSGGIYEERTLGAMLFRMVVTFVFTIIAYFKIK